MEEELGQGIYDEVYQTELTDMLKLGEALCPAYDEWATEEANPSDKELTILGVEKRLLVRIPGTYTWIAAKLDAIVEYMGALWTMEHKSQSRSSKVDNPTNTARDIQMGLQLLALRASGLYDLPIGGAIYNLARKQAPSSRVKNPIFGRHIVQYTEDHLANLAYDLKEVHVPDIRAAINRPTKTRRRYNPGIGANSFCDWGCHAKEVCEAINRNENASYLFNQKFKFRDRSFRETLFEEMEDSE